MKEKIIGWFVARFAERSSAVGVGAMATFGWQLYVALQGHDQAGAVKAGLGVLFGAVAFCTHDGRVLAFLGDAQDAAKRTR